jgi:acetyl esterase/lipase
MRGLIIAMALFLTAGCSPLALFNKFTPKDQLAGDVANAVAYGEDPRQRLDVYPAPGAPPHPVIVFFYGGSWDSGSRELYSWAGRALAAQGFVTVLPDYRLVPDVRYPTFVEDAAAAIAWTYANARRFGGDPGQIFVAGHSAGAYIAAQVVLDPRFLRTVDVPPSAIKGVVGLSGPYDFLPLDANSTKAAFGRFADLPATQPVNFARADAPPFLLIHGAADTTVYPKNTRSLAAHLREAGAPVRDVYLPDLSHTDVVLALSKPLRGKGPVLEEITAFVRGLPD